ncbi:MAG: 16S rRNA (uracil(1498)-N(3))-methyltransferase [Sphingomonadaceae bacterium]
MARHSFFVDPAAMQGERVELTSPIAHQIRSVLRLRPGDTVDLLDGSGCVHEARLVAVSREGVVAEVVNRRLAHTEPGAELVLYQALLKGEKMELVLQKGTEIGVSRFVPVLSERCVSRPGAADLERRIARWQTIVREAAEQSKRGVLPGVAPVEQFGAACRSAAEGGVALMAWEEERALGIGRVLAEAGLAGGRGPLGHGDARNERASPSASDSASPRPAVRARPRVALLIGPEGGFSEREAETARGAGVRVVSLGPRILRAETAALVAATLVLCATGDLGGLG